MDANQRGHLMNIRSLTAAALATLVALAAAPAFAQQGVQGPEAPRIGDILKLETPDETGLRNPIVIEETVTGDPVIDGMLRTADLLCASAGIYEGLCRAEIASLRSEAMFIVLLQATAMNIAMTLGDLNGAERLFDRAKERLAQLTTDYQDIVERYSRQ